MYNLNQRSGGDFMRSSLSGDSIQVIRKRGKTLVSPSFVIKSQPLEFNNVRVAFAIPRTHGNAVIRNKFRRRLRSLITTISQPGNGFFCQSRRDLSKIKSVEWQAEVEKIKIWCKKL